MNKKIRKRYFLALDIMKIFAGIYLYLQRNETDYWRFFFLDFQLLKKTLSHVFKQWIVFLIDVILLKH
jgi:hypothetical protein